MKKFTDFLIEGVSLMKDKKVMSFLKVVVEKRLKLQKYKIYKVEKAWKKKDGVGLIVEIHFDYKSYAVVDTYKIETYDLNAPVEDVIVNRIDTKKINKPSDDDWEN